MIEMVGCTYFKEENRRQVMYKSGGRCTQVDYVLCRRRNLKEIIECKVVVGDSVARQNQMVFGSFLVQSLDRGRKTMT